MRNHFPTDNEEGAGGTRRLPLLIFLLGFTVLLLFGWTVFPSLLYDTRSQPLQFNHKVHTKIADNSCDSCHTFRADGSFTGIPGIDNCRTCHVKIVKERDEEIRLITDYIEKDSEIPWFVYARQPDSVFFSHAAHVRSAELPCERCHGDIGESSSPKIYSKNRLTGYSRDIWGEGITGTDGMRMDDCVACHLVMKHEGSSVQTQKEGCFVCHK